MKRFLLSIAVAFIPVLGLEAVMRQVPNEYSYKMDYIQEHCNEVNTVVLGHSELLNDINPSLLNQLNSNLSAFNMALSAQGVDVDHHLLKNILTPVCSIRYLIWSLSYQTLYAPPTFGNPNNNTFSVVYLKYNRTHYMFTEYGYELLSGRPMQRLKRYLLGVPIGNDSLGYRQASAEDPFIDNLERYDSFYNYKLDSSYFEQNKMKLREMCNICRQRGIQFIMITPPVTQECYGKMKAYRLKEMHAMADSLIAEYDNVCYINLHQDERFAGHRWFYDVNHLNDLGANKLTRIVAHCIDSIECTEHRLGSK